MKEPGFTMFRAFIDHISIELGATTTAFPALGSPFIALVILGKATVFASHQLFFANMLRMFQK